MTAPFVSMIGATQVWSGPPKPVHTIARMKEITLHEYEDAHLVEIAVNIADEVDGKNPAAMAGAILAWLRVHTRFVPDPVNQQLLKSPLYMLKMIQHDPEGKVGGDCTDLAMLAGALAMAVGMTVQFVAESYAWPCNPATSPLVHVYAAVSTQYGWLALDTQQPADGTPIVPCRRIKELLP